MSDMAQQVASMVDMLPEQDQSLDYEAVKKLVLAWDPDFTKVTPTDRRILEQAEKELGKGDYVLGDSINWN